MAQTFDQWLADYEQRVGKPPGATTLATKKATMPSATTAPSLPPAQTTSTPNPNSTSSKLGLNPAPATTTPAPKPAAAPAPTLAPTPTVTPATTTASGSSTSGNKSSGSSSGGGMTAAVMVKDPVSGELVDLAELNRRKAANPAVYAAQDPVQAAMNQPYSGSDPVIGKTLGDTSLTPAAQQATKEMEGTVYNVGGQSYYQGKPITSEEATRIIEEQRRTNPSQVETNRVTNDRGQTTITYSDGRQEVIYPNVAHTPPSAEELAASKAKYEASQPKADGTLAQWTGGQTTPRVGDGGLLPGADPSKVPLVDPSLQIDVRDAYDNKQVGKAVGGLNDAVDATRAGDNQRAVDLIKGQTTITDEQANENVNAMQQDRFPINTANDGSDGTPAGSFTGTTGADTPLGLVNPNAPGTTGPNRYQTTAPAGITAAELFGREAAAPSATQQALGGLRTQGVGTDTTQAPDATTTTPTARPATPLGAPNFTTSIPKLDQFMRPTGGTGSNAAVEQAIQAALSQGPAASVPDANSLAQQFLRDTTGDMDPEVQRILRDIRQRETPEFTVPGADVSAFQRNAPEQTLPQAPGARQAPAEQQTTGVNDMGLDQFLMSERNQQFAPMTQEQIDQRASDIAGMQVDPQVQALQRQLEQGLLASQQQVEGLTDPLYDRLIRQLQQQQQEAMQQRVGTENAMGRLFSPLGRGEIDKAQQPYVEQLGDIMASRAFQGGQIQNQFNLQRQQVEQQVQQLQQQRGLIQSASAQQLREAERAAAQGDFESAQQFRQQAQQLDLQAQALNEEARRADNQLSEQRFQFDTGTAEQARQFQESMGQRNFETALQAAMQQQGLGLQAQGMTEQARQFGIGTDLDVARMGEQSRQFNTSTSQQDFVNALRAAEQQQALGLQAQGMNEQSRQFGVGAGLDAARLEEQMRQFDTGASQRDFETALQAAMQQQGLGLQAQGMGEDARQFNMGLGENQRQFDALGGIRGEQERGARLSNDQLNQQNYIQNQFRQQVGYLPEQLALDQTRLNNETVQFQIDLASGRLDPNSPAARQKALELSLLQAQVGAANRSNKGGTSGISSSAINTMGDNVRAVLSSGLPGDQVVAQLESQIFAYQQANPQANEQEAMRALGIPPNFRDKYARQPSVRDQAEAAKKTQAEQAAFGDALSAWKNVLSGVGAMPENPGFNNFEATQKALETRRQAAFEIEQSILKPLDLTWNEFMEQVLGPGGFEGIPLTEDFTKPKPPTVREPLPVPPGAVPGATPGGLQGFPIPAR